MAGPRAYDSTVKIVTDIADADETVYLDPSSIQALPPATATTAGLMTAAEFTKLDGLPLIVPAPSGDVTGVTDSAAIAAVITASRQGQQVLFQDGTYWVNATINFKPLRAYSGGSARGTVIKQAANANLHAVAASAGWLTAANTTSVEQAYWSHIRFDGNSANQTSGDGHGLVSQNYYVLIEDVQTSSTRGDGIRLDAASRDGSVTISNTMVECKVVNCTSHSAGGDGFKVADAAGSKISDGFLDNFVADTPAGYGANLQCSAGWMIRAPHAYSVGKSGVKCSKPYFTTVAFPYVEGFGLSATVGVYAAIDFYNGLIADSGSGSAIVGPRIRMSGSPAAGSTICGIAIQAANSSAATVTISGGGSLVGATHANTSRAILVRTQNSAATVNLIEEGQIITGWDTTLDLAASGVVTFQRGTPATPSRPGTMSATDKAGFAAWLPISTRTFVSRDQGSGNQSDGTNTGCNTLKKHTATVACTAVKVGFANVYNNTGTVTANPYTITVRCAIFYNSIYWPVWFGGSRDIVLSAGAAATGVCGVALPVGATFYTRTYVTVASGDKYPFASGDGSNSVDEGAVQGTGTSDLTTSGTITVNNSSGFSPYLLLGRAAKVASTLCIGDSIMAGKNDTSGVAGGWIPRAFGTTIPAARLFPFSGETINGYSLLGGAYKYQLATEGNFTNALVSLGINDITGGASLATVQARYAVLWAQLQALGLNVVQSTITPVTTSTDGWVTTANQTVAATNGIRTQVNDWIRTLPAPLSHYVEVADAVETARNSGIWKANYVGDGTHPLPAGYAAMAAAVDLSVFALS